MLKTVFQAELMMNVRLLICLGKLKITYSDASSLSTLSNFKKSPACIWQFAESPLSQTTCGDIACARCRTRRSKKQFLINTWGRHHPWFKRVGYHLSYLAKTTDAHWNKWMLCCHHFCSSLGGLSPVGASHDFEFRFQIAENLEDFTRTTVVNLF